MGFAFFACFHHTVVRLVVYGTSPQWLRRRAGSAPRKRAPPPPRRLAPGQCPEGTSQSRKGERVNLKPDLLKSRDHSVKGFEDSKAFSPGIDKLTKAAQVNQPSIRDGEQSGKRTKSELRRTIWLEQEWFSCFHHNVSRETSQQKPKCTAGGRPMDKRPAWINPS